MMADFLSTEDDDVHEGEPLIHSVMAGGRRISSQPSLHDIRAHARRQLERLPVELTTNQPLVPYPVQVSNVLEQLAAATDRRLSLAEAKS